MYRSDVRSTLSNEAETRPDISKISQMTIIEIGKSRGKTSWEMRIVLTRNRAISTRCNVQEIGEWIRRRSWREEWKKYVSRTSPERVVGNVRGNSPTSISKNCKRKHSYRQIQEM
jgi:hypothetical protein